MHYLVRMLVEADNSEEALQRAENDCQEMVENGTIDWFDMDGRWGTSKAYGINSQKGKKLIEEGMENNRKEFDEALEAIRYMLNGYSNEDIYNEKFDSVDRQESGHYISRYQFAVAAGNSNVACVYAMDGDLWGNRVNDDRSMKMILENSEEKKLWVVPVDVHN